MKTYSIYAPENEPVLQFAANELIHYGKDSFQMAESPEKANIVLHSENTSKFQDSFSLKSRDGKLYITGSNPRSVLFGVYEYLKKHGFAFLYPAPISLRSSLTSVTLREIFRTSSSSE